MSSEQRACYTCGKSYNASPLDRSRECDPCLMRAIKKTKASLVPRINWRVLGTVFGIMAAGVAAFVIYFTVRARTGVSGDMRRFADEMCACQDVLCADLVDEQFDAWRRRNRNSLGSQLDQADLSEQKERYRQCAMAIPDRSMFSKM